MEDTEIERVILSLLAGREPGKTICPSDAARRLADGVQFRALMDDVRRVAFGLADRDLIEVTQHGRVIDGRRARGPIRLRLSVDRQT